MDGVFMRHIIKWTAILLAFACLVTLVDLISDKRELHDSLIRLHVVGASNDDADQTLKLQVRDAVTAWITEEMAGIDSADRAREFLRTHLTELESVANQVLSAAGADDLATVSFLEEEFPVREYDTFTLPSGIYHSLRICIGEAQGRNWWCVVFPSLCLGATTQEMKDTAVSSGFDEDLTAAISGEEEYQIRFFLLDCLGAIENFFHMG